jgi:hypothetical protein
LYGYGVNNEPYFEKNFLTRKNSGGQQKEKKRENLMSRIRPAEVGFAVNT